MKINTFFNKFRKRNFNKFINQSIGRSLKKNN